MQRDGKRVLITDGACFTGTRLYEKLLAEHLDVPSVDNFVTDARENVTLDGDGGQTRCPGHEVPRLPHSRSTLEFQPLPQDDPRQRRPDITEASERLGCIPAAPQEEGLLRIILRFRQRYFA